MTPPPTPLLEGLTARLPTIDRIEWVEEVGSTNAVLAGADDPDGRVLVTDLQTAGRGRKGRGWHAPPGSSLLLSVGRRPGLQPSAWSLLPLVAGSALVTAVRRVLSDVSPDRMALKWPNDLLLDGVKAAGILVESTGRAAIIGIGANVDWRGVARPPGVVATSLAEFAGHDVDRWEVLAALLESLDHLLRLADADPAGVVQRYVPDCGTIGMQVRAHGHTPVEGTAVGLTPDGHLRISAADGRQHVVTAGDVTHLRNAEDTDP